MAPCILVEVQTDVSEERAASIVTVICLLVVWFIFRSKRLEVTGRWGKLHNGDLHNLHSSPDIHRTVKWTGHIALTGETRNPYNILVGNP
jgi:hypothetical protein